MSDHLYFRTDDATIVAAFEAHWAAIKEWAARVRAIQFSHAGFAPAPLEQREAFGGGARAMAAVTIVDHRAEVPAGWRKANGRGVAAIVPRKTRDAASSAARAWASKHLIEGPHSKELFEAIGVRVGFFDATHWRSAHTGFGRLGDEIWVVVPGWAPTEELPCAPWVRAKTSEWWAARERHELTAQDGAA